MCTHVNKTVANCISVVFLQLKDPHSPHSNFASSSIFGLRDAPGHSWGRNPPSLGFASSQAPHEDKQSLHFLLQLSGAALAAKVENNKHMADMDMAPRAPRCTCGFKGKHIWSDLLFHLRALRSDLTWLFCDQREILKQHRYCNYSSEVGIRDLWQMLNILHDIHVRSPDRSQQTLR